jgi:sec-independent protein translocase protein TatA
MFRSLGTVEIIVIAVVLLLLFGGKKLPELARGVGQAGSEFRKGFKGEEKAANKKSSEKKEE